jgi:hypothetical protein
MRSIPLAMTWELLRHGPWSLLGAALGANALPVILFAALRFDGAIDPHDRAQITMHVALIQLNLFLFGTGVFAAQGSMSRLYTFPVPASSLVAWHLLPAMTAVMLEMVVSAALLNWLFGLSWPLWGPALFGAVALVAVRATQWLTEKSGWMVLAMALVVGLLGFWFMSRYGLTYSNSYHYWVTLTPAEVFSLLLVVLVAYAVAVLGVSRNRCGQPPFSLGIVDWLIRAFDWKAEFSRPFRSPEHAQLWFHWRVAGSVMPTLVLFGLIVGPGIWLLASRDIQELLEGFCLGGVWLWLGALFGGLVLGSFGRDRDFSMRSFLATRPITSAELARTLLKTGAKSLAIAWCLWAVPFLILYFAVMAFGHKPHLGFASDWGWWYLPATLVAAWITMGIMACVCLTGRAGLIFTAFFGPTALLIGLTLFWKCALSHEAQVQFWYAMAVVGGALFMLATAWAFVAALRRSLIDRPTLYSSAAAWLALTTVAARECPERQVTPISVFVLLAGMLALAVAPLAAAPLALAWNRNR